MQVNFLEGGSARLPVNGGELAGAFFPPNFKTVFSRHGVLKKP
jgi:hypothetical protein